MSESFRSRLRKGELLIGTLITLPSPEIAEIIAGAGFDWIWIDLEHSAMDAHDAQNILQAVGGRVDCIVRVPLNDEIWIKKVLDAGASGVLVPQVNSVEEAQRAVRFSKYPLQGGRSVGISRAQGYGPSFQAYLDRANEDLAVIVQIEHIQAVRNVEGILAVEGIDAVLVGPYDLSASLGVTGRIDAPEVQAAMALVETAAQKTGKPLGIYSANAERAKKYIKAGYKLVAAGEDIVLLSDVEKEVARALKG